MKNDKSKKVLEFDIEKDDWIIFAFFWLIMIILLSAHCYPKIFSEFIGIDNRAEKWFILVSFINTQ